MPDQFLDKLWFHGFRKIWFNYADQLVLTDACNPLLFADTTHLVHLKCSRSDTLVLPAVVMYTVFVFVRQALVMDRQSYS